MSKGKPKKEAVQTSARETELEAKLAAATRELQESKKSARELEAALAKSTARITDLEAKLAKPVDAAAQPAPPTNALAAIAAEAQSTTDPLALQVAAYRALAQTFFEAAADTKIGPRERRKELRTISASMAKLFPESRRWEVEQLIKSDREAIAKRASEKAGAKLEPRRSR